jgi:CTP:phosphocholine cytidylyltransferase-like protein/thiamine kinase-like enzyme
MTKHESDILLALADRTFSNQRELASYTGYALGAVNKAMHSLIVNGYIDASMSITEKGLSLLKANKPKQAIILAAGFGMRMVPINHETPKAFLEIDGQPLVERLICQLQEVGIHDIKIVVGFMKEQFDYLIDKYGVQLIVNPDYARKNNLHSLALASRYIVNAYIVPSDVWCEKNPFSINELYSWYMVSEIIESESDVRVNRKKELVRVTDGKDGNSMVGISYLCDTVADQVKKNILDMCKQPEYDGSFWETALYKDNKMMASARVVSSSEVVEINTYEQLRDLDDHSEQLKSDALEVIAKVFNCNTSDILDIQVLKKGMTNRSFLFTVNGAKYIMRIPGEGTDQLINREDEAEVFSSLKGKGLCDDPVYINPRNGYKITKFLEGIRTCDPYSEDDLMRCMRLLKKFHDMKLEVNHKFDLFEKINFYESLWNGEKSVYRDYEITKQHVFELKDYIDKQKKDICLTHIDAVYDNFLFYMCEGEEKLQLTDWEYSSMQDPHVDLAMFSIYAFYNKEQVDHLLDLYYEGECPEDVRTKVYAYMAICGLLWSNWCEYKSHLGIEFGEYSLRQYRYAKDYYKLAKERM